MEELDQLFRARGLTQEQLKEAIASRYINKQKLEEALELLQEPVYGEEGGVDGYIVYVHELRELLNGDTE